MDAEAVIRELRAKTNPAALEGMKRFGITTERSFGLTLPQLRETAKRLGKDHRLALGLWSSGIREARILAAMVDDPARVTERQMEAWVGDIDSWDVCDGCCGSLFWRTQIAYRKALEWSGRKEEFVKRAGFSLMASLAVHDKAAPDEKLERFFEAIERQAADERNFVRKAVNWALRQIGKRNARLNRKAIAAAERIRLNDSRSARWIASDALRELKSEGVQARLRKSG